MYLSNCNDSNNLPSFFCPMLQKFVVIKVFALRCSCCSFVYWNWRF